MIVAAKSFAAAVNHLLARETWAREQLQRHHGRAASLALPPITLRLTVSGEGYVRAFEEDGPCDVKIAVPAVALADFVTGGQAAVMKHVKIEGDAEFANTISYLAQHLRWEAAEDLSKLVGDAAAHRITETARAAAGHVRQTGRTAAESLAEYFIEENPQLVRRSALDEFSTGVARLRDDLARLEKRLERLNQGR